MGLFYCAIIEETVFRYHLKDLKGAMYFFFISLGLLVISQINEIRLQTAIMAIALILAVLVIDFLKKKSRFYFTAIVFGLVHLSNYKDLTVLILVLCSI